MLKISASGFDLDWCGVALTWLPALVLDGTKLPGTLLEGGQSNAAVFRISPDASWHFRWRFEGDTLLLDSDIENHGAKPIALGKALPLDARCPARGRVFSTASRMPMPSGSQKSCSSFTGLHENLPCRSGSRPSCAPTRLPNMIMPLRLVSAGCGRCAISPAGSSHRVPGRRWKHWSCAPAPIPSRN
jgi:hypothetical protein